MKHNSPAGFHAGPKIIQVKLEFQRIGFSGAGEKSRKAWRITLETTTSLTHIQHQHRIELGFIDGRRVLSLLHHPFPAKKSSYLYMHPIPAAQKCVSNKKY